MTQPTPPRPSARPPGNGAPTNPPEATVLPWLRRRPPPPSEPAEATLSADQTVGNGHDPGLDRLPAWPHAGGDIDITIVQPFEYIPVGGEPPVEVPEPAAEADAIPPAAGPFEQATNDSNPLPEPCAPTVAFALDYARRGWPVFPCRPENKAPFFTGGFHAATTDEKTIRGWWGYWPKAMIGVPMGARSGVWAIDPDPPRKQGEPDGREMLARLVAEHDELPATHTEITPRGGQHIVFRWDPDRSVTNSPGALAKTNIDVRGEGGYIVVAPSICIGDGSPKNVAGQYRVAEPLDFFHFAIAPDWLFNLVLAKPDPKQEQPQPALGPATGPATPGSNGGGFFRNVNDAALMNPSPWVTSIFNSAKYQTGTGAWRVSPKDLGRELEEDLSIAPTGIKDWGVHDLGDGRAGGRTAIDLVIEYGGAPNAVEAALWLCERIGITPETLGWNDGPAPEMDFTEFNARLDALRAKPVIEIED
jgi:Bifunctional DNA primase/polymerase, N-terminal